MTFAAQDGHMSEVVHPARKSFEFVTNCRLNPLLTVARRSLGFVSGLLLLAIQVTAESHPFPNLRHSSNAVIGQESHSNAQSLDPGKAVERTLKGGETHSYQVRLTLDQFALLVADQRGIDVALTLFNPAGIKIREVNSRTGERGVETASLVAKEPGVYGVEVRSIRQTDPASSYQLRLERLHTASDQDRAINSAEQLISEGGALQARQSKDSLIQAIAKYRESLELLEATNDQVLKAIVLNRIGKSHYFLGEYQLAVNYHTQALPFARAAGDQQAAASTLHDLGQAYRLIPDNEKALAYLNQALQLWQVIQDRRGEWETLVSVGRHYSQMGEGHKSLSCLDQALQLSRVLSNPGMELNTLSGLGGSYYTLGEFEKAGEIWKQALALATGGGQQGMEMLMLGKLGAAYNALGDNQEALNYLNHALRLARNRGDRVDEAGSLQTIGRVYRSMREPKKSIEFLDQSLVVLKDVNNPPTSVARAHYNLGKAYTDLGEHQKAIDYLNQALLVWKSRKDPINIAATVRELARAERGRGNLETALAQSEAAINLMEWIRTRAGGPELRASYLAIVQNCYELRVDVLSQLHKRDPSKGYAAAALQTSESAHARSLLESLVEAGVDIRRGVDPDLLKREQTISAELGAKATEQVHLLGQKSADSLLTQVSKEIKNLSAQHELVEAEIRAGSARYAELIQPQPLSLAEIREQVIDGQTLLLEYFLGEERSYLWAVTSTSIETYELPGREVIETASRKVYELLTARNQRLRFETPDERRTRIAKADADYPAAANALSQMVLGPATAQLGKDRLLIVSDGALQYIPFASLPAPGPKGAARNQPLTVNHEVVSLPSASTLAVLRRDVARRKPAAKTITVFADPVFVGDDPRVMESVSRSRVVPSNTALASARRSTTRGAVERSALESGWNGEALSMARLPFTRREAEAIKTLVPAAYRDEEVDFAANLANATSADLSQYRVVHFATHGFLNSRHPELSGIVLSLVDEKGRDQDGFLRAHEIYDLKIPAELVVLSGCRTGLGKEIKGEGLIGLTRAFMHAGAARVMVSLWDVNDEATAELMTRFYSRLLGPEKVSPAAALRAAQVSMAQDKRWSSPYFWAGFTLQGEPR
jgi:CHAT domain-containing protein